MPRFRELWVATKCERDGRVVPGLARAAEEDMAMVELMLELEVV